MINFIFGNEMKNRYILICLLSPPAISNTHDFEFDRASGAFCLLRPKVKIVLQCGNLFSPVTLSKLPSSFLEQLMPRKMLITAGNCSLDLDNEYWGCSVQDGDDDPVDVDRMEHIE
jgi:hypothetical protein